MSEDKVKEKENIFLRITTAIALGKNKVPGVEKELMYGLRFESQESYRLLNICRYDELPSFILADHYPDYVRKNFPALDFDPSESLSTACLASFILGYMQNISFRKRLFRTLRDKKTRSKNEMQKIFKYYIYGTEKKYTFFGDYDYTYTHEINKMVTEHIFHSTENLMDVLTYRRLIPKSSRKDLYFSNQLRWCASVFNNEWANYPNHNWGIICWKYDIFISELQKQKKEAGLMYFEDKVSREILVSEAPLILNQIDSIIVPITMPQNQLDLIYTLLPGVAVDPALYKTNLDDDILDDWRGFEELLYRNVRQKKLSKTIHFISTRFHRGNYQLQAIGNNVNEKNIIYETY